MSYNRVTLIGRVGKDPENRTFSNGNGVTSFSLATEERWKDKGSGDYKTRTEWHNVAVFNPGLIKLLEVANVKKGSRLFVEGAIKTRKWEDTDGNDRYSTEIVLNGYESKIVLLDPKQGGSRSEAPADDAIDNDGDVPF